MYLPGKSLLRRRADIVAPESRETTAVIDLTAATPVWGQTAAMNNARVYHTLTMLPNGKVLAVGGNTQHRPGT